MTILHFPTDGRGIYEGVTPLPTATSYPRLDAIAAAGFKVVINYSLLFAHMTDIIAYINHAASVGLKVLVALHNPVIWRDGTYATTYATLYADAGSPGTGIAFMQYIVAQTKSLPGVYGWYIGDEVTNTDHTTFKTYADAIKAADSTHPRLIIEAGGTNSAAGNNTSLFYDCCEIMGDDYYAIGASSAYSLTVAQTAAGIQSYCIAHNLSSAMTLQAFSWAAYGRAGQPWPTEAQMQQNRYDALSNMRPRLLLWYSYFDAVNTGSPGFAPALQWQYIQSASQGRSGIARFPSAVRRGIR